jgi:hypothetical protein
MKKTIIISYLIALAIIIFLAWVDSDPIKSPLSLVIDVFFLSILCWTLVLPITLLITLLIKRNGK